MLHLVDLPSALNRESNYPLYQFLTCTEVSSWRECEQLASD